VRNDLTITLAVLAFSGNLSAQAAPATPASAAPGQAGGTVGLNDLPPAVKATVEAETRKAALKSVSREQENGKTVFELESVVDGRTRDLMIDSAGKVYLIEEQVDLDKAPTAVTSVLERSGRIVKLESVTTRGQTHYEGHVRTKAGKTIAIEIAADGKPITP